MGMGPLNVKSKPIGNSYKQVHAHAWGMREMYVRDLDGNSLRFGCPVTTE
jgi:hypothetical protein